MKVRITFLIGPVRQPILSLGKLNSAYEPYMEGGSAGKIHFPGNKEEVEIQKIQNSYQ